MSSHENSNNSATASRLSLENLRLHDESGASSSSVGADATPINLFLRQQQQQGSNTQSSGGAGVAPTAAAAAQDQRGSANGASRTMFSFRPRTATTATTTTTTAKDRDGAAANSAADVAAVGANSGNSTAASATVVPAATPTATVASSSKFSFTRLKKNDGAATAAADASTAAAKQQPVTVDGGATAAAAAATMAVAAVAADDVAKVTDGVKRDGSGNSDSSGNKNNGSRPQTTPSDRATSGASTAAAESRKFQFPCSAAANAAAQAKLGGNGGSGNNGFGAVVANTPTTRSESVGGASENGTVRSTFPNSSLARGVASVAVGPPSSGAPVPSYAADNLPPLALPGFYPLDRTVEGCYRLERKISEGTYGEVFLATDLAVEAREQQLRDGGGDGGGRTSLEDSSTSNVHAARSVSVPLSKRVAIKKIKFLPQLDGFPVTSVREISVLLHLARVPEERRRYFAVPRDILMGGNFQDTYLVFDLVDHSLHGLLQHRTVGWSFGAWRHVALELCRGVRMLHDMGIMHRDLKANNVLVSKDGRVMLCDYGLAVSDNMRQRLTPSLIALDFRPPEMLLGMETYDERVDVWSTGCLLAHIFINFPPFSQAVFGRGAGAAAHKNNAGLNPQQQKAQSELEQLVLISEVLGIQVPHMMGAETARSCKKLQATLALIEAKSAQQQQQQQRRHSSASSFVAGGNNNIVLPGRSAPKNDRFEQFLRGSYQQCQIRLYQKMQQQQEQQQLAAGSGPMAPAMDANNFLATATAWQQNQPSMDAHLLDLIVWMLRPDPSTRPRMRQVLEHPFFTGAAREERTALAALRQQLAHLGDAKLH